MLDPEYEMRNWHPEPDKIINKVDKSEVKRLLMLLQYAREKTALGEDVKLSGLVVCDIIRALASQC